MRVLFSYNLKSQNLSTLGPYLKDDNSNNVILRGMNLFMIYKSHIYFHFTGHSQHEFKRKTSRVHWSRKHR